MQGMFCGPLHGAIIGMASWKMIGFSSHWHDDIDEHFREVFRPAPKSLIQIAGRRVKGRKTNRLSVSGPRRPSA
jgi:hypothetical protein